MKAIGIIGVNHRVNPRDPGMRDKTIQRPAQNALSGKLSILLGDIAGHARAASSCDHKGYGFRHV